MSSAYSMWGIATVEISFVRVTAQGWLVLVVLCSRKSLPNGSGRRGVALRLRCCMDCSICSSAWRTAMLRYEQNSSVDSASPCLRPRTEVRVGMSAIDGCVVVEVFK
eukprot:741729-Amphidinium_carterae.1